MSIDFRRLLFNGGIAGSSLTSVVLVFVLTLFGINVLIDVAFSQSVQPPRIGGVASGDVTYHSAMVWGRTNKQAYMNLEYSTNPGFESPISKVSPSTANETTDFASAVKLDNLKSNMTYYYRVWFSNPDNPSIISNSLTGKFRTAPDPLSSDASISFIVGGDLGGQGYCRRVDLGYPIFYHIRKISPDFFVFLGDQIYGDEYCTKKGPENITGWNNIPGDFSGIQHKSVNWNNYTELRDIYNKHWEYNREDNHLQELLKNIPMYSMSDDHDVVSNYGNWSYFNNATRDRGSFYNVVKAGMDSFFSYSPIDRNQSDPYRVYRSFNWGKDLELFLLDAHSYRSRNDLPNTYDNKTLYGKEQIKWLEDGLLKSNATWKVVFNPVPVTVPNCVPVERPLSPTGCDNWATNQTKNIHSFSNERDRFLKFVEDHNIRNVLFITTDIHFPANIEIQSPLAGPNGQRSSIYELVSGPLSAKPNKYTDVLKLDPTLDASFLYREGNILNFGYYEIKKDADGKAHFIAQIYNATGIARPGSYLDLIPQ